MKIEPDVPRLGRPFVRLPVPWRFISGPREREDDVRGLVQFGAQLQGIGPEDFTDLNSFFGLGREPKGFDICRLSPAPILTPHGKGALQPW